MIDRGGLFLGGVLFTYIGWCWLRWHREPNPYERSKRMWKGHRYNDPDCPCIGCELCSRPHK